VAVASSLAVIVITSASSVRAHHRRGGVRWDILRRMAAGIAFGAIAGAVLADQLSFDVLRSVLGLFLMAVAMQMGLGLRPRAEGRLPALPGLSGAGVVIGCFSALVGIGGGTLTVPFLSRCGVAMREAVATAAACGMPIALAGALGFVITGWGHPALPDYATGYVYWPAVAGIALASYLLAPVGARLAHRLPPALLRRVFAVLLGLIGIRMLLG
ncbi:MAG: sulfite exporter TauE/SafE family protein, partial [Ectothiorhodospiraceae bacterium]|nr:sulfite exporter TauE/SafE family protein [Ectothiorhodospiraceae bacterium]